MKCPQNPGKLGKPGSKAQIFQSFLPPYLLLSKRAALSEQSSSAAGFRQHTREGKARSGQKKSKSDLFAGKTSSQRHVWIKVTVTQEMLHLAAVLTPLSGKAVNLVSKQVAACRRTPRAPRQGTCLCRADGSNPSLWLGLLLYQFSLTTPQAAWGAALSLISSGLLALGTRDVPRARRGDRMSHGVGAEGVSMAPQQLPGARTLPSCPQHLPAARRLRRCTPPGVFLLHLFLPLC